MAFVLKDLAASVPGAVIVGGGDAEITAVEYHSKMVRPGALFVAITGFQQDGNDWIDDALNRGAAAVVTETESVRPVPQIIVPDARAALADLAATFYDYRKAEIVVCGVTGTNGKTTSCFLLRRILEAGGRKAGLITSLVYDTGTEQLPAPRTTPESLDMFRLLAAMKDNECSAAVVEISSHALMLQRVKNLEVQVALFTNFTRDHLDFHTDMNDYLHAKMRLLEMVSSPAKWAVVNYDCAEYRGFIGRGECSYMTYSLNDPAADVFLKNYDLTPGGSDFELVTPAGMRPVAFHLPGRFNLYNAVAAAAAAVASGVDLDAIVTGLETATVIPGRLERIETDAPFHVFVDFAHTPDALTRTIETLREIGSGRILTLFGCGGDRDRGKRPLMGETVSRHSDYAVLTMDNPRTEDPAQIIDDVRPGLVGDAVVDIIEDRRQAIFRILKEARDGDMVLLAGKGAEDYQEINGVRHPFKDSEVAGEVLAELGYGK